MRDSVDTYGQTTVMVTHEPRAAAIADRILFLADGLIVRDLPALEPGRRSSTTMSELAARVIRFALKGLLGRKLRTALTALAIVLGVAMVSGTYVLTDSIDKAFDSIFTDVRQGLDAVVTRQGRVRPLRGRAARARRRSTSRCSSGARASTASRVAEGSVDSETTS